MTRSLFIEKGKQRKNTIASKMWQRSHGSSEEGKLELRLGPPSEESLNESIRKCITERNESPLTLGYFSTHEISTSDKPGPGGAMVPIAWHSTFYHQHQAIPQASSFFQLQSRSQICCVENKAFSPSYADAIVSTRTVSGPLVGWPPIRSFRKNIASGSSSKLHIGSQQYQHFVPDNFASRKLTQNCDKDLFVKINMDGVPIGRKLNINAYDSYEKLSSGVDELFRGLLAEMKLSHIASSHCAGGIQNKEEEEKEKAKTGFLVGSGEYTLVYEDNEGDNMLVGDVPWHMFVSTVKRLRVLKSSDLPAFARELESFNLIEKNWFIIPLPVFSL